MMNFLLDVMLMFFVIFGFSCFSFVMNSKHLLSLLLSLEAMMMSLFCIVTIVMSLCVVEMFNSMVVLTFIACEAAVGLSVLVNMISIHGSSHVNSMSLMKC